MRQASLFEKPELPSLVHTRENSRENEKHLNANRPRFNCQCKLVIELLKSGEVLTTRKALLNYNIGDLRRRIKDLKDSGIEIQEDWELDSEGKTTRFKKWWIKNE